MKVRFFNIVWDGGTSSLPREVIVDDFDGNPEEEGADCLSDRYGFCINSMSYEILEE